MSVVVCICGKRKRRESIRLLSPYIIFSVVSSSVGVRGRKGGWSENATGDGRAGSRRYVTPPPRHSPTAKDRERKGGRGREKGTLYTAMLLV